MAIFNNDFERDMFLGYAARTEELNQIAKDVAEAAKNGETNISISTDLSQSELEYVKSEAERLLN